MAWLPAGIARATGRNECWPLQTADRRLTRRLLSAIASTFARLETRMQQRRDTSSPPLEATPEDGTNPYLAAPPNGLDRATIDRILRHIYDRLIENYEMRRAMHALTERSGQHAPDGPGEDGMCDPFAPNAPPELWASRPWRPLLRPPKAGA